MPDDDEELRNPLHPSGWIDPNITTHDTKIWGVILSSLAVVFGVASIQSGVFNGLGLAALLFATGAIAALWEGSR